MRSKVLLIAASVIFGSCPMASAALTLSWTQDTIDPLAFTTGNATTNGKLPVGAKTFSLHGIFTGGTRMGGGAARFYIPTGRFYRYTSPDPDTGDPVLRSFTRPGTVSLANPAQQYTSFVTYPNVPASDSTSGGVSILGALRYDGTQGPASEAIVPTTTGDRISVVWGSIAAPAQGDGDYILVRLTTDGAAPQIHPSSVIATITASGGAGADVHLSINPSYNEPPVPEPASLGLFTASLLLGVRRRKSV